MIKKIFFVLFKEKRNEISNGKVIIVGMNAGRPQAYLIYDDKDVMKPSGFHMTQS